VRTVSLDQLAPEDHRVSKVYPEKKVKLDSRGQEDSLDLLVPQARKVSNFFVQKSLLHYSQIPVFLNVSCR
jgi:hypothetical protein